jgi:hypothetical protein
MPQVQADKSAAEDEKGGESQEAAKEISASAAEPRPANQRNENAGAEVRFDKNETNAGVGEKWSLNWTSI